MAAANNTYFGQRESLRELNGDRGTFTGVFRRFGIVRGHKGKSVRKTVLLESVRDESGVVVTDHIWLGSNKIFHLLGWRDGDLIQFSALVGEYWKDAPDNYIRPDNTARMIDYGLCRTGGLRVLERAA
ncbi:MAG: hypothetical protein FWE40_09675 [Oscillospiraceae bacterium]|nr:hypothetical protein [Oscillospiraceae bacterium]